MKKIAGTHLTVDAYVAMADVLTQEHILATFTKLVAELKMEQLGEPVVREVPIRHELLSTDEDEGGISIIMPITTSHISIHAWPARKAIMMDVFSCCPFMVDTALDLLKREFQIEELSYHVVHRTDPRTEPAVKVQQHGYFPWNSQPRC